MILAFSFLWGAVHSLQGVDVVRVVVFGEHLATLHVVQVLTFDHFEQVVPLRGRQFLFEGVRVDQLRSILDDLLLAFIMRTRRHESALRAATMHHKLALKVHCGFLELREAFLLKHLPDFLLAEALATRDQLTLLTIEAVTEARDGRSVVVSEG